LFLDKTPSTGLLLVDDGSTDATPEILESIRSAHPGNVDWFSLPRNSGKAEAVRQGFLRIFPAKPQYLGYWDADLATPLETITRFKDLLENRDHIEMVFGARVQLLGRRIQRSNLRHYSGRIFATLVSCITHLSIYDSQCGAKLFRLSPDLLTVFQEPFLSRWIFDIEIITRCMRIRKDSGRPGVEGIIYEYPLEHWQDVGGSKITVGDALRSLSELWMIRSKL